MAEPQRDPGLEIVGHCPICCQDTTFVATTSWFRGSLTCRGCAGGSLGSNRFGSRIGNIESQTFGADEFDIVITQNVMEHVFNPAAVYREIHRKLNGGGVYIHTFPIRKWLPAVITRRAQLDALGMVEHLTEPEYHGNPIGESGALVKVDCGYDVHQWIAEQASFDVRVYRLNDAFHGVLGEYTDVVACFKRAGDVLDPGI